MKAKNLILTLSLLLLGCGANAQLLWKVTPPQGTPVSYIFATHHVAPLSVLDSVKCFNDALASVERVYGELDMSQIAKPENVGKLTQAMLAPADSTISRLLTPVQLDSVTMAFQKYAGPQIVASMLEPLTPMALANQLAVFAASQISDYTPGEQLDTEIQNHARLAGKIVDGLETLDLQMNLLYGAPLAEQASQLMRTVADVLEGTEAFELYNSYRSGNLDALISRVGTTNGYTDEEADRFIYNRNAAWVEFLLGALPTASIMIAVGGAHLPGPKGVLKLLKDKGYKVEPANCNAE